MMTGTMFVLAVPDLEVSGAFYRDVLGFDVREIGDPGWRMFVRDSAESWRESAQTRSPRLNLATTLTLHTCGLRMLMNITIGRCLMVLRSPSLCEMSPGVCESLGYGPLMVTESCLVPTWSEVKWGTFPYADGVFFKDFSTS